MAVDTSRKGCSGILINWFVSAVALWLTAWLMPGIEITHFWPTAFWAALSMGLVNSLIKPILFYFTLPITILTLGIFAVILNTAMFLLSASFIDGFMISGWIAAFFGSLVLSFVSTTLSWLFEKEKEKRD